MESYPQQQHTMEPGEADGFYADMNEMQRRAVFKTEGPLLILAGAGSGKTTVLINRIDYLVRFCGVRPWNILAITFTNKAAGELKNRLSAALGPDGADVFAATFHSTCVRILRREIGLLGFDSGFGIYDTDDSLRVIKTAMGNLNIAEKMLPPKTVLSAISRAKDTLATPEELFAKAGSDYRAQLIARCYNEYQRILTANGALDFDDIICHTVRIFRQFPEALERCQNRWRYIMVDEYQDTNHAQYLLIGLLAAKYRNLCVVGDDDQSIYKFRGATIENILSFEDQFPDAAVIRLEQNYRSTQNILSAANSVIANNRERKGKNLWTDAGDGQKLRLWRLNDETEEARAIADDILDHVKNGGKFGDNAILYRMNAQSSQLERALAQRAAPYRLVGGLRFYERKEIKDAVAYLSVIANPHDSLRLLRAISEPKRGIGAATLEAASGIANGLSLDLFEVLETAAEYAPLSKKSAPLMAFAAMIRSFQALAEKEPLDVLFDEIMRESGYMRSLELLGDEGIPRIENILELKSNIMRYQDGQEEPTLSGFLEEIALYTDLDNYDTAADAVTLMTVHSAKGLEFDRVYLAGMEEGVFPGRNVQFNPAEIEEERRLAYVAITRARHTLTAVCAERRLLFGSTNYGRPSRFLDEIPPGLLEQKTSAKPPRVKAAPKHSAASFREIGVGSSATPAAKARPDRFSEGDRVRHAVFGEGTVLEARSMAGDTLLKIEFDGAGIKKIMLNYVKLEKIPQ